MSGWGTYLRRLWEQMPSAWGPMSVVQVNFFNRVDALGIDPMSGELAMPMWGPGDQHDYSKNRLVGVNNGADFQKNSLRFNGTSDSIKLATESKLFNPGTNDFTILAGVVKNSANTWGVIFSRRGTNALSFRFKDSGDLSLYCKDAAGNINGFGDEKTYKVGQTYNVVCTRQGSTLKTFTDGVQTAVNVSTLNDVDLSGIDAYVSRKSDTEDYDHFDGYMQYLYIISTLLTDAQIAALSDNPYQLWQRPVFRTFSIPKGPVNIFNLAALHASKPTRIIQ